MNMSLTTDPSKMKEWDNFMSMKYGQQVSLNDRLMYSGIPVVFGRVNTICQQQVPPIFWELLIQIQGDWWGVLVHEFAKKYFIDLCWFLNAEYLRTINIPIQIYPRPDVILRALQLTPFRQVKVVIIGQDPYPGDGQAMGLSFSVPMGKPVPPSLKNIFKVLEMDPNIEDFTIPDHGNLESWAVQGVLLLNATLTVEAQRPNCHARIGWQTFTNEIIKAVSTQCNHVVFILFGKFAQKKGALIDSMKHKLILAGHPSPLAFYKFYGDHCFSDCNSILTNWNMSPINWSLTL